jgi:serine protease
MTEVAGGGEDILKTDYVAPSAEMPGERIVVEFYNSSLNHYFITAEPDEEAMLDAGVIVPGWQRTGFNFKERPAGDPRGLAACRFFGTPGIGPNSHFYTIDIAECAKVKTDPFWTYEGIAFNSDVPVADTCTPDRVPVVRLYNDGMGGQASHRYVTSHSEVRELTQRGWIVEGNVFCAIP